MAGALAWAVAGMASGLAWAQQTQTLTLRDGTQVTGEVLEYVKDDHVTLRLASGESRRLDWRELAPSTLAPPSVQPGPSPSLPTLPPAVSLPSSASPDAPSSPPPPPTPAPPPFDPATPATTIPYELRPERGVSNSALWNPPSAGLQTGYGSPFGYLGLLVEEDFFQRWVGLQAMVAMPVADEPVTVGIGALMDARLGSIGFGAGVGYASSFTKIIVPGSHPGSNGYLVIDVSHFSLYFSKQLGVRAGLGMIVPTTDEKYCQAHPEACPQLAGSAQDGLTIYGTLTLLFTFDFSHDTPDAP